MYIECKCADCKYCFEGDCQLNAVNVNDNKVCMSYEKKDDTDFDLIVWEKI